MAQRWLNGAHVRQARERNRESEAVPDWVAASPLGSCRRVGRPTDFLLYVKTRQGHAGDARPAHTDRFPARAAHAAARTIPSSRPMTLQVVGTAARRPYALRPAPGRSAPPARARRDRRAHAGRAADRDRAESVCRSAQDQCRCCCRSKFLLIVTTDSANGQTRGSAVSKG